MVLAPTVSIHGASFDNELPKGPPLPAAKLTKIPFCMALNAAIAVESSWNGNVPPPSEIDITLTPSAIAASMPAKMSLDQHSVL
ncbi:hypothetical protein HanPSC8_Chr06g0245381 [Helianthus annuus]|nr:hypothetical protein HanPSC8_Chr06g0245381 [Helianthus annuus]